MLNALVFSLLLLAPQQTPAVSITLSPDTPAVIIPRSEAEAQFKQLCEQPDVTLIFDDGNLTMTVKRSDAERLITDPDAPIDHIAGRIKKTPVRIPTSEDVRAAAIAALADQDQRLKALAAELNPMPNWPQMVMNGDASVCNRSPKPLVSVPVRTSWENPK